MVKMAAKLPFLHGASDLYEGINVERMRRERAEKVRAVLRKNGVPAMLVAGPSNVRYVTGFSWREFANQLSYALFFADHDPIIYAHAGIYQQMPDLAPWIKEWRIARSWLAGVAGLEASREEGKYFAEDIKAALKEKGIANEQLAVVHFDHETRVFLQEAGLNIVDGTYMLYEASSIKTVDEINCFKTVASICSAGFTKALEVLKPGITQNQAKVEIMAALAKAGSENPVASVTMGPLSFERNIVTLNRIIEYGDLGYVILCGNAFHGYPSCLYRTYIVGRKPTPKEADLYKAMKDRVHAVIDAIKPGSTTDIAAKQFPPASNWGYKSELEVLTIEFGHGLSLVHAGVRYAKYSYPIINRLWSLKHPQVFEPGMVIAVESCDGEHRVGGVRMEHMIVVTETGAEIIDHFPCEEILVAGQIGGY